MKQLSNLCKIALQAKNIITNVCHYASHSGVRFEVKLDWKKPEKKKHYDPLRSLDTAPMPKMKPDDIVSQFKNSEELETASEKVKKIFSLGYQSKKNLHKHYVQELVDKVKEHPFDTTSRSVKIARLTAFIRFNQNILTVSPPKSGYLRRKIDKAIGKRIFELKKLRSEDYKRFEWILSVLELQFKPGIEQSCRKITRKKSLLLLAQLQIQKAKEAHVGKLKKEFDQQKVPFLEKKLTKLKEIKQMEEKYNFPRTVTQKNIDDCIEKLEKVKIEVANNERVGYIRKIHPYFIEPYNETLLLEKEKSGEILREKMNLEKQHQTS